MPCADIGSLGSQRHLLAHTSARIPCATEDRQGREEEEEGKETLTGTTPCHLCAGTDNHAPQQALPLFRGGPKPLLQPQSPPGHPPRGTCPSPSSPSMFMENTKQNPKKALRAFVLAASSPQNVLSPLSPHSNMNAHLFQVFAQISHYHKGQNHS